MISVIISFCVSLALSILLTPVFIRFLIKKEYGQFIRQDGPTGHYTKRGTPTMGGVVFIFAILVGWLVGFLAVRDLPDYSSVLVAGLFLGLGVIGFLDDFIKISRHRSLGLNPLAKIIGQLIIGSVFAGLALWSPGGHGPAPASMSISLIRPTGVTLAFAGAGIGIVLFVLWANFLVTAWSNAVNLTDGLDGLATGASLAAFGGYTFITFWQFSQSCIRSVDITGCYEVRDPLGLAVFSAAVVGGLIGFLWWNASPAQIFMGDTGSLALGGAFAAISILSHTEFLAVIIGGLFVVVTMSDVIQIVVFKRTGKRVFRMAPLHHHFELKGWHEVTIVVRFWIVAALFAIIGVGLFYAEWVATAT